MPAGELLYVLAASYDDVDEARAGFDAVRALYEARNALDEFDAAILAKNEKGKLRIDKTFYAGTQHVSLSGLGWGMAAGVATAVLPSIGVWGAVAAGGGSGAAIGAIAGHIKTGMTREELRDLGNILAQRDSTLVVVYGTKVANRINSVVKSDNRFDGRVLATTPDQISEDVLEAEAYVAWIEAPLAFGVAGSTDVNVAAGNS